jgi:zinc protease
VDDETVVASAPASLKLVEELSAQMTPAAVEAGMKALFSGAGPRMMLLSPEAVSLPVVNAALTSAEKAAPAVRQADRAVSFASLPPLGSPGKEVSRQSIADLGVTIVGFANGSSLVFKQTDFEKGSVQVQVRWGEGVSGLSPTAPSYAWLGGLIAPSGFADFDQDALERLMTGRRLNLNFGVAEDAFELQGLTNGTDLADQLRLLATKLAYPRWDDKLFRRFQAGALESYDLSFASAAARAGREFGGFARPNDRRWAPVEKTQIAQVSPADLRTFFTPLLANGPAEVIVVGDVDIETAVAAVAKSIGALPPRPPARVAAGARQVQPPRPDPSPKTFTHSGDKDQAYALIGWTTFGGTDRTPERRALALAANIFQVRLFERLREAEGASYSPNAASSTSEAFKDWGVFYAASELKPASAPTFFRIAREIIADMAAKAAAADEFARAQNPVVTGIERRLKTNAYWLSEMENWSREPALMERTRSYLADYRGLTAEDVRAAVARHVAEAGDWSMLVLPGKAAGGGH